VDNTDNASNTVFASGLLTQVRAPNAC